MNDLLLPVDILSRWVHVLAAVVLLGGSIFMRYVLMPAAEKLPDDHHTALRDRILASWWRYVMTGVGLLLVSGFYNYIRAIPKHKGDGLYHGLLGTKIILAFAVFFLASALVGRSKSFEPLRQARKKWLTITIVLATLVVLLGGVAKVATRSASPAVETTTETASISLVAPRRFTSPSRAG